MRLLLDIADRLGGRLVGDGETPIAGISGIKDAKHGEITFLTHPSFAKHLKECQASAIIIDEGSAAEAAGPANRIIVKNPGLAYIEVARMFAGTRQTEPGISALANVSSEATVSPEACVMPFVFIGRGSAVEKGVVIYPSAYIGENVTIGEESIIYPNASLYDGVTVGKRVIIHAGVVLGSDGFGYVWDGSGHRKIPQIGSLIIEDDVEIGANTTIDRASLGTTVIKKGAKIDNLVQIAHNVSIGENSIIVAQVGVAGSATIGRNVLLAGQAGVRDHVTVGNNVRAGGQTGITKDVPDNSDIMGTPHLPIREWLRLQGYLKRLPELFTKIARIEKTLEHKEK
jgi:UDP-3-O-[3-hydroxymyristoyl] glucosamine N-acyltransferase